ncbi:sodium- and chloride-dependent glycine transporter 2-like [Palaemon carinicauda]|uniref:sodium- and chloride-dependent glycine transporter 2-like n=1 Tax=Palaemon carinicauda TaxID=392227 RepID=UPI0035B5CE28
MTKENVISTATDRGTWNNKVEFLLSCLGYAVGLGNVWRFPFLVYKNGGATFLIPYVTMLLCAGLPMFFMELAIGQYVSFGPDQLFQRISPIFSGIGWAMVAISLLTCTYYNIIMAWAFFYAFASFNPVLPWGHCNNDFNSAECYDQNEALNCRNLSLHYYNRSCFSTEEYCGKAKLQAYNVTHCLGLNTSIISAKELLPKITPSEEYFTNRVLGISGTSWENLGDMKWELVGCLALAWVVVALSLMKGIRSSGKVVYFTATFPYVILVVLFIRGITLEGSYKGMEYYILKTNWTRLKEVEVWSDAASQIFYSLGVSFGSWITLASYNKFNNNCMRDALLIGCSNCLSSVFAGFVIFFILGFLANELGVEVEDVVASGSGLAFVVYPAAVSLMPLPQLWSILFFLMLITVGLDTQFTMMETVITAQCDQIKSLRERKPLVVFITCFVTFLLGLTMCLEGGTYMFELFNYHAAGLSLIVVSIFQIIVIQYVYGFKKFMKNIREMNIHLPNILYGYWAASWLFLTPFSLGAIFIFSIYFMIPVYRDAYIFPVNIQTLGWFICATSISCIPLGAIYVICRSDWSFKSLIEPTQEFCPAHERDEKQLVQKDDVFSYIYTNDGGCWDVRDKDEVN